MMNRQDIFSFLIEKAEKYESPSFIENDPIKIPHHFSNSKDIQIVEGPTVKLSEISKKRVKRRTIQLVRKPI